MQFLRQTGLYAASLLLITTLFFFGLLFGVERVFGTSASIKNALRESGTYQTVIGDALDQAAKQQTNMQDIPVDRPEVRAIITETFPPSFLQTQTEQILDSFYSWLRGTTPELAFTLDLSEAKVKLADSLGNYASQQAASLPVCTAKDLPKTADFDPFTATCVPPNFDPATAAAKIKQEILGGEFMKDTHITAANLKTDKGERIDQAYHQAPRAFQNVKSGVYGLGVLAALVGAAIVFLSKTRRSGLRKISIVGIGVGAAAILCGWFLTLFMQRVTKEFFASEQGSEPLQQNGMAIIQILANNVHNWWTGCGIVLVVLGAGGLIALHVTKPKETKPKENLKPEPATKPNESSTEPTNKDTVQLAQKTPKKPKT